MRFIDEATHADAAPLLYHGKPMDLRPRNISVLQVRQYLDNNLTTNVVLEPGDGTRYTLVLAPAALLVWVIRTETAGDLNSDAIGVVPVGRWCGAVTAFDLQPLTRGNEWTGLVLAAFLNTIVGPMQEAA